MFHFFIDTRAQSRSTNCESKDFCLASKTQGVASKKPEPNNGTNIKNDIFSVTYLSNAIVAFCLARYWRAAARSIDLLGSAVYKMK